MKKSTTQLEEEIYQLKREKEELTKQIANEKSSREYYSNKTDQLSKEINEIHLLLDSLSIARTSDACGYKMDLSIMARLFLWQQNIVNKK